MKKTVINFVMAFVLCAMMSVMVMAAGNGGTLTFSKDTAVNGTVVKKGDYKVTFDEQTNEVTIWQGKNALVKAPARVENRTTKASRTTLEFTRKDNEQVLTSITVGGSDKTYVIGADAKTTPIPPTLPTLGLSLLSTIQ